MSKKVILDLDIGVDDTMALMEAIANPEFDVIGITTVYGNVARDISTQNALDLTDMLGHSEIEVHPGATQSIISEEVFEAPENIWEIHGKNGLGNIEIPRSSREASEENAADYIARMADEYGEDLTIVATGPLTNIAEVVKKHPEALKKVGNLTIMGGAVAVEGNVSPFAEANISNDPEAAKIVLEESGANITLVPLDVTMAVMINRDDVKKWRELGKKGKLLADEVEFYIDFYEKGTPDLGGCALHDPLAVAVAADPSLVTTIPLHIKVDTEGPSRGRTIGDKGKLRLKEAPVQVAVQVDVPRFEEQINKDLIDVIKEAEALND